MDLPVIFENSGFVVINKPPGIVVNKAESVKGITVQDWFVERYFKNIDPTNSDFYKRGGIVHRIDKDTSGLLIIAKTLEAFNSLQSQFKDRKIKKTYIAWLHGIVVPAQGRIDAPISRLPWNRERFGIMPDGKPAVTAYKILETISIDEGYSLAEIYPESGRTHQIRVHFKYINHPLVKDELYGGRKTVRKDRSLAPRILLHAKNIVVEDPQSAEILTFEAPVPKDFIDFGNLLKQKSN